MVRHRSIQRTHLLNPHETTSNVVLLRRETSNSRGDRREPARAAKQPWYLLRVLAYLLSDIPIKQTMTNMLPQLLLLWTKMIPSSFGWISSYLPEEHAEENLLPTVNLWFDLPEFHQNPRNRRSSFIARLEVRRKGASMSSIPWARKDGTKDISTWICLRLKEPKTNRSIRQKVDLSWFIHI